jgi:hypothetical protein
MKIVYSIYENDFILYFFIEIGSTRINNLFAAYSTSTFHNKCLCISLHNLYWRTYENKLKKNL